jgi:hypothetical protein
MKRKSHTDFREQRRAPRASGDQRDVAREARAITPEYGDDARALHDERIGADALFDPGTEASRRRRPCVHGGDGIGLAVDRTVHSTATVKREAGRESVCGGGIDQLDGYSVFALLADRRPRLRPTGVVERDPQAAAAPVAGLRVELAIELGPASETLERHRPLGGIATHDPNAGGARAGGRVADPRALEYGHARPRLGAAQVERRAEPHQTSADDDDLARARPHAGAQLRADGAWGRTCRAANRRAG